jgi:hypothetical protein
MIQKTLITKIILTMYNFLPLAMYVFVVDVDLYIPFGGKAGK